MHIARDGGAVLMVAGASVCALRTLIMDLTRYAEEPTRDLFFGPISK